MGRLGSRSWSGVGGVRVGVGEDGIGFEGFQVGGWGRGVGVKGWSWSRGRGYGRLRLGGGVRGWVGEVGVEGVGELGSGGLGLG